MTWALAVLVVVLFMGWLRERLLHDELGHKTKELMEVTLDLCREHIALRERYQAYLEIDLEDGPGAVIPNVIGDDERPVDIRA